jgi:D-glycero-D-manno-heptose 1,7-bisphosphate phosphatase
MTAPLDTVLLDRDGTVIEDVPYIADPEQVRLIPGAGEALGLLASCGFRIFTVSNQSGIGRGYLTHRDYRNVQERMRHILRSYGVRIAGESYCPHPPREGCSCRKPETGMWERLRLTHGLDPARSVMIGDKLSDIGFARRAGLSGSVLVLTGHGREEAQSLGLDLASHESWTGRTGLQGKEIPHILARDLPAASRWMLARAREAGNGGQEG